MQIYIKLCYYQRNRDLFLVLWHQHKPLGTLKLDNDIDKLYSEFRSRLIYQVVFWHKTNYVEQLRRTNCVEFIYQKNIFLVQFVLYHLFCPKTAF